METILLATDGSSASDQALDLAIELARATGATLEIISVRAPRLAGRLGVGAPLLAIEELEGPGRIAHASAEVARAASVDARSHGAHGDVVTCIVDTAATLRADLLVVGSRGLGSVSGAMLGSVSQAVVRRSPVPVTVVRRPPVQAIAARA